MDYSEEERKLYEEIVRSPKSFIIAPAGYGKTHTIAECLKYTDGKSLILTHTHAGVASLKSKISELGIPKDKYNVETLDSYTQKYVHSYYMGDDLPTQDKKDEYFKAIRKHASKIFESELVHKVIQNTYSHIFVDEYQDCSVIQHELVMQISKNVKLHIFGDPLQGIFDFDGEIVDLDSEFFKNEFKQFELLTPHRWIKSGNKALGDDLVEIRSLIKNSKEIQIDKFDNIEYYIIQNASKGYFLAKYKYFKEFIGRLDNLLIVFPPVRKDSTKDVKENKYHENIRISFAKSLKRWGVKLIEAIDREDFYTIAKKLDSIKDCKNNEKLLKTLIDSFFQKIFNKKFLEKWFNLDVDYQLFRFKKAEKKDLASKHLHNQVDDFLTNPCALSVYNLLEGLLELPDSFYSRIDLLYGIQGALKIAASKNISVYEAMIQQRNIMRRKGRNPPNKILGTTLLTKGLEFDNVIILEADEFEDYKHLYVALTRSCKRLIIFSKSPILKPSYSKSKNGLFDW